MEAIKKFFLDLGNIFKYIYQFSTNEDISRLRVFLIWGLVSLIPSFVIAFTVNTWQVHIPGVESQQNNNGLLGYITSTSILPLLFFITNGLRGYHEVFNKLIDALFSKFEMRNMEELIIEFGQEDTMKKLKRVDLARYISAFLLLEFIIISWAIINYFFFGRALTELGLAGYILDDLLLGAIVLILEGVCSIFDGFIELPSVYKIKPLFKPQVENEPNPWFE